MHSAAVLALLSASLAAASPLHFHQLFHKLHKKEIVTDVVTDIVMATVTVDGPPPAAATAAPPAPPVQHKVHTHTNVVVVAAPSSAAAAQPSVVVVTQQAAQVSVAPSSAAPVASTPSTVAAAPATTAVAASGGLPTDYASTAVYNHNQHRANHSASALAYNQTLADWAAITAKTCVFAHDMSEGTANYGQNIAAYGVSSGVPTQSAALANAITDMWYYGEVNEFPFGVASPDTSGVDFLHFSQAVWKSSQTVGCATQQCGPNTVLPGANYDSLYTVCNYFPAGNMMGSFNTQVTKSTDSVGTLAASI